MPRLNPETLRQVKYVSLVDFNARIDEFENFDDKLNFATKYLLTHGVSAQHDYSFAAAIHFAQMKISDAAAKSGTEKKGGLIDDEMEIVQATKSKPEEKLSYQMFMGNPSGYLKAEAAKLYQEIDDYDYKTNLDKQVQHNAQFLADNLDEELNNQVERFEHNPAMDFRLRMESHYGGRHALEEAREAVRGGFFSRMFSTSSLAWKNLNTVYDNFQNNKHAFYGDKNALEKAAAEYVTHRFPSWKKGDPLPSEKDLFELGDTERARTEFSLNILRSVAEQRETDKHFDATVEACKGKNVQYSDAVGEYYVKDNLAELKQSQKEDFRQKLENDLIEEGFDDPFKSDEEVKNEPLIEDEKEESLIEDEIAN